MPSDGDDSPLETLISAYLERAEYLILILGPRSLSHRWINWELSWWIENRDVNRILVCVSHGADPAAERVDTFPAAVLERRLDQRIWFDLRGFDRRHRHEAKRLSSYGEERVRLAAELIGVEPGRMVDAYRQGLGRRRRSYPSSIPTLLEIAERSVGYPIEPSVLKAPEGVTGIDRSIRGVRWLW